MGVAVRVGAQGSGWEPTGVACCGHDTGDSQPAGVVAGVPTGVSEWASRPEAEQRGVAVARRSLREGSLFGENAVLSL